jgi:hypothetical protein
MSSKTWFSSFLLNSSSSLVTNNWSDIGSSWNYLLLSEILNINKLPSFPTLKIYLSSWDILIFILLVRFVYYSVYCPSNGYI